MPARYIGSLISTNEATANPFASFGNNQQAIQQIKGA